MNNSVKKNYIYNLIYQILAIIMPVVTTPYISRVLGAEGTGIYGYTISIATYFILFGTFGISLYGQREIAYVQNSKDKINKLFTELTIIKFITMIISLIIFYLSFCLNGEYVFYYKILLLEIIAYVLDINWLFQGLENFKDVAVRNILVKILSVISIFIFVKSKDDTWIYLLIYSSSNFLGNTLMWLKRKKYVNFVKINEIHLMHHLKPIFKFFIPQIAIQVYTVLDKTMIGAILQDMNQVGYYEQAQKIIKILLTIITSLGTVMMPRIASCYAKGDSIRINKYIYKSFNFLYLLSYPMIFGIIVVSNNFVPLFLGDEFNPVIIILSLMSVIILFIGMSNIIGNQLLLTTKKENEYTISVVCGAIVNFILNTLLISKFYALGAGIATIFAELIVALLQLFYIRKKYNIKKLIFCGWKYFLSACIMFLICLLVNFVPLSNFILLVIKIVLGCSVYLIMLLILKDDFFKSLLNLIISIFKKNHVKNICIFDNKN